MNKSLRLAAFLAVLSSSTVNADYQIEITGSFQNEATKIGNTDFDYGGFTTQANYYFRPVFTEDRILAEAAFLNKASHLGLRYKQRELEIGQNRQRQKIEGDNTGFSGRFVIQGHGNRDMIVEANLALADDDGYEERRLAAGVYLDDQTEILVGIQDTEFEAKTSTFVKGKKLFHNTDGQAIIAQAKIQVEDGNLGLEGEGDLYLSNQASFGAKIGLYMEDDASARTSFSAREAMADGTRFALAGRGQFFANENIAIGGQLGIYNLSEADLGLKFHVTGRF